MTPRARTPDRAWLNRFASYDDAHAFCARFVDGYNHRHRHSGIAFLAPADVHYGRTDAILAVRAATLSAAYDAHPERFVRGRSTPRRPPAAVYINPPHPIERYGDEQAIPALTDRSDLPPSAAHPGNTHTH